MGVISRVTGVLTSSGAHAGRGASARSGPRDEVGLCREGRYPSRERAATGFLGAARLGDVSRCSPGQESLRPFLMTLSFDEASSSKQLYSPN